MGTHPKVKCVEVLNRSFTHSKKVQMGNKYKNVVILLSNRRNAD